MCAFGLAPLDATDSNQFYRHRTGLAFPRHPAFRQALFRLCPGISAHHQHVPLKGSRTNSNVTRCADSGVYSPQFVKAVVDALQTVLVGRGRSQPHHQRQAGGQGLPAGMQPGQPDGGDGSSSSGISSSSDNGGPMDMGEWQEEGRANNMSLTQWRLRSSNPWRQSRSIQRR